MEQEKNDFLKKNNMYALFYNKGLTNEDKWSCGAVYALKCDDTGFELCERNPLTARIKKVVKTIDYNSLSQISIEGIFENNRKFFIKHVYDEDPRGYFFNEDCSVALTLTTIDNETWKFIVSGIHFVIPILEDIAIKNNIEICEKPQGFINDLHVMDDIDLYKKYIEPKVKFPTHLRQ